jgi:hypothetical protein
MGKKAIEDFTFMIDHAIDREELEDIRQMIREASDLTLKDKRKMRSYLNRRYKMAPELRL